MQIGSRGSPSVSARVALVDHFLNLQIASPVKNIDTRRDVASTVYCEPRQGGWTSAEANVYVATYS